MGRDRRSSLTGATKSTERARRATRTRGKRTADGDPTFDLCRGRRTDSACAVRRSVPLASASRLFATERLVSREKREETSRTRARLRGARFAKRQNDRLTSRYLYLCLIFHFVRNVSHTFSRGRVTEIPEKEPPPRPAIRYRGATSETGEEYIVGREVVRSGRPVLRFFSTTAISVCVSKTLRVRCAHESRSNAPATVDALAHSTRPRLANTRVSPSGIRTPPRTPPSSLSGPLVVVFRFASLVRASFSSSFRSARLSSTRLGFGVGGRPSPLGSDVDAVYATQVRGS